MSTFVSFDIEVARGFPQYRCKNCGYMYSTDKPTYQGLTVCPKCQGEPHVMDWRDYIPLGLSCAATTVGDTGRDSETWITRAWGDPTQGTQMLYDQFDELLAYLERAVASGVVCVTWNGVGFDLPFLADAYPYAKEQIKALTRAHCDPAFQMFCERGYMISLDKAAHALGAAGKTEGMRGDLAPLLWTGLPDWEMSESQGKMIAETGLVPGSSEARQHVIDYVKQDAITTALVYAGLARGEKCAWITANGAVSKVPWTPKREGDRLLTVVESQRLPEPKGWTGFTPKPRSDYDGWL